MSKSNEEKVRILVELPKEYAGAVKELVWTGRARNCDEVFTKALRLYLRYLRWLKEA